MAGGGCTRVMHDRSRMRGGAGRAHWLIRLSHWTIDHASLSRRRGEGEDGVGGVRRRRRVFFFFRRYL